MQLLTLSPWLLDRPIGPTGPTGPTDAVLKLETARRRQEKGAVQNGRSSAGSTQVRLVDPRLSLEGPLIRFDSVALLALPRFLSFLSLGPALVRPWSGVGQKLLGSHCRKPFPLTLRSGVGPERASAGIATGSKEVRLWLQKSRPVGVALDS